MIDPNLETIGKAERTHRSIEWLMENYRHIWWHKGLSRAEKAGFLAACCHPTRCFLMTLDLIERVSVIKSYLPPDDP